jgi:hypothetical protein
MYRCPSALLGSARKDTAMQVDLLMRAYMHYEGRHVLPVDGGLLDQSRAFLSACEIIDAERGRLEQMKETKREREREAAKSRNQMRRHGSR